MKHSLRATLILIAIFLSAQIIGLGITNNYIDHEKTAETGEASFKSLPYDVERPQIDESFSFAYIITAIIIATALVFVIMHFKQMTLWKLWFFLAVFMTLTVAFNAFIGQFAAVILAVVLALWKVVRPNIYIHNLTEMFIYGGLAAIFVPIINLFAAFVLLILISGYDAYAVWKSKHMIKLAKFQTKSKMFAGLLIPYRIPKKPKKGKGKLVKVKTAVLGGGDIGFPLIFAGVVMKGLMLTNPILIGFLKSLIIPLTTTVALGWLLIKAEKDKFYPAMPFLSIGCIVGYLIVLIL
ncbi:presenilin family intramembrane aspartyl protease [Nanoarchaeota archaeon]